MLAQLYIENIAVIHKADIRFVPGLNIFTGETGAGKTMLISAIDAVLGERTSKEIIRTGESRAMVSALFEDLSEETMQRLDALGYPAEDGTLLITRELTTAGKSSCKISGRPATLSILREIAALLIHIHGQRDSRQLLFPEQHLAMIDAFGETQNERTAYRTAYDHMKAIAAELNGLNMDETQKMQRIDLLSYQIGEIEAAELDDPEEEEQLLERREIIRNSESIAQGLSASYAALYGNDEQAGLLALFDDVQDGVDNAARHIGQFSPMAEQIRSMGYELEEYAGEIRDYLDNMEFDPRELDWIESRLDTIYKLSRKYGGSIAEILEYYGRACEELESIQTVDERTAKLEQQLAETTKEAEKLAKALGKKRQTAVKALVRQVEEELTFLDMPSVKLSAVHRAKPLSVDGADEMELMIVTNVGEQPKPLSKIASGGELARIMLAVKNVLADKDHIPTLVFDEVDTGVSGRAAQKIGHKLRQVSRARQVLCVTHLAQVAAYADQHLFIHKEVEDGRTFTHVDELDDAGAVAELARMTSGDIINAISLENARQLRENARSSVQ